MGTLMALDIASVSGMAVGKPDDRRPIIVSKRIAHGGDLGAALVGFERWMLDQLAVHQPEVVVFEAPLVLAGASGMKVLTNQATIRMLFGLAAVAELVAHRAGLDVYEVNVQEVRKHFCGSGRADKSQVMRMCQMLGWPVPDHNGADAAAAWSFARAWLYPEHAHQTTPLFGRPASEVAR